MEKSPMNFRILAKCSTSMARVCVMELPHATVSTPVFMPVGTKGSMKGVLPQQLLDMDCRIILANTYHLGTKPGVEVLSLFGGLHNFMCWPRALLTDSGGFQMVSLLKLAKISEHGVQFRSPFDDSVCTLTPEHSIGIQNTIGADIIMQLDDVVSSTVNGPRVEEAMYRTTRWLDRCISANQRSTRQSLFPIVQGGLDAGLRKESARQLSTRDVRGYAIGGLSGGEEKDTFWRMVKLCTCILPEEKPRYVMGVGWAVDIVVCVALGCDMCDCVYPTRTARFGCALYRGGQINLKQNAFAADLRPIDETCSCSTCQRYTRSYLNAVVTVEPGACNLITIHNLHYQLHLMSRIRQAITEDKFAQFVINFMNEAFSRQEDIPEWIIHALSSVNIHLI